MAVLAAAMAAIGAVALAHPGHPPLNIHDPSTVEFAGRTEAIPLDLFRGQRIFVPASVAGKKLDAMLDTAAGATVIDKLAAQRLGLVATDFVAMRGVGGVEQVGVAHHVALDLGGMQLRDVDLVVMDLSPIAASIGRPLPLILGKDLFNHAAVTIDFARQRLSLSDPDRFIAPAGAVRLPLADSHNIRSTELTIGDSPPVAAQVDLGNPGAIGISKAYWESHPQLASLRWADGDVGGVGGRKPARFVTLPAIEFAGQRFRDVPALANDAPDALPTEGVNIGIELLKRFVVTFDFGKEQMFLQPLQSEAPFRKDRAGVRTELHGDRLRLGYVSRAGPGAAAGLKAGDEIAAIDGQPVTSAFYTSAKRDWNYQPRGTPVTLTRADGSTVHFKLADYY